MRSDNSPSSEGRLQKVWKEIMQLLILFCYGFILVLMALAYWPMLRLFSFLAIFFIGLFLIVIVFKARVFTEE
jgi:CHASE2 domain-containing sensor protein